MHVLAIYSAKGGVGKTAAAVNLAYQAAWEGLRVLVWDLDPQGATSYYFRIRPRAKGSKKIVTGQRALDDLIRGSDFEGLDLLPADATYRNLDRALHRQKKPARRIARLIAPLAADYDLLLLDCPNGFSLMAETALSTSELVLVPVIPTPLSMRMLDPTHRFLPASKDPGPTVLSFFSMADRRKQLHRSLCDQHAGRDGFLTTVIPYASEVERMGLERAPLLSYDTSSRAARAFRSLWDEVRMHLQAMADR